MHQAWRPARRIGSFFGLLCVGTFATAQTWYIESAASLLDPTNRYIGALVATNRSDTPVYVRAAAFKVDIQDGKRLQTADTGKVLGVYPDEFVLAPQSSFTVRLVADTSKIAGPGQSFYVRLRDISDVSARGQGGMSNSILLAYDSMVAVSKSRPATLVPAAFDVVRDAAGATRLVNRSVQHVFLQAGYQCAADKRQLVDCTAIADFPVQSMLPGESLPVPPVGTPLLGLLLRPTLNAHIRPQALMIPTSAKADGSARIDPDAVR